VAHASTRVPSMVYGAPLLQDVALGRYLGEDQRALAPKDTPARKGRDPQPSAGILDTQGRLRLPASAAAYAATMGRRN
jgi:hypothetical protein